MSEYTNFRQRLDTVLRTLDVQQVQQFLIDSKQWSVEALPADPEFSMYMMIAGSAALPDLHERARTWLVDHGHADEAQAMLGSGKKQETRGGGKSDQRSRYNARGSGNRSQEQKRKGPPQERRGPC